MMNTSPVPFSQGFCQKVTAPSVTSAVAVVPQRPTLPKRLAYEDQACCMMLTRPLLAFKRPIAAIARLATPRESSAPKGAR